MSRRLALLVHLLSAALLFLNFAACSQKAATGSATTYSVSGFITQTHSYCGGMKPPADLLLQLNTPRPLAGKKLFVRSGKTNTLENKILKEIMTDTAGHFSVRLPAGNYCILQEEQVTSLDPVTFKKKLSPNLKVDETCLKQWWGTCLMTFDVVATDKSDLRLNFHIPCFTEGLPCVNYTGPMPQ